MWNERLTILFFGGMSGYNPDIRQPAFWDLVGLLDLADKLNTDGIRVIKSFPIRYKK